MKKLGVLVAVFALCAIGAANASAANFTASAVGSLTGKALENQVFTTNGGTVTCTKAATSGEIKETTATKQHVTVNYSGCTAFGFATVHISAATYNFTSNGEVHIESPVTITVTAGIFGECTVTVGKQTVSKVDFKTEMVVTEGPPKVEHPISTVVTPTVEKIKYTSTGGVCGSSGENGTYKGANTVERVGGGFVSFDP